MTTILTYLLFWFAMSFGAFFAAVAIIALGRTVAHAWRNRHALRIRY